jgi:hypothetical protein
MRNNHPSESIMLLRLGVLMVLLISPASAQLRPGFPTYVPPVQPAPRWQPPFGSSQWQLGVTVRNIPNGAVITRTIPGSVALQAGLEIGDTILSVSGGPVGFINGQLYDLQDQLNRRADPNGRVVLRIRNVRDGRVRTVPVRLAPGNGIGPVPPIPGPGPGPISPVPPIQPLPPAGGFQQTVVNYYRTYLGRNPSFGEINHWSGVLANGMTLGEFQANMVGSGEYYDRCGNTIPGFINAIYQSYVGRLPLPAEQVRWTQILLTQYGGNRIILMRQFLTELGKYP